MASCAFKVATCNLNQWALDFDGNLERTLASIHEAKRQKAVLRVGPELELSGYSCEDHFLELDTFNHCYESLSTILNDKSIHGIICAIGMPVIFDCVRYNTTVFILDSKILLIRPKVYLADDGNYRERRYFTGWRNFDTLVDFPLPTVLRDCTGQTYVPFGLGILSTAETMIAAEICEELWAPDSTHLRQALLGVEIFCNGSGSHHQLRKLGSRLDLIRGAMTRCGGAYIYSNQKGCDGNRLYFDGCAMICVNGHFLAQGAQFSLKDVEVVVATIDLNDIRSYRQSSASYQDQSNTAHRKPNQLIIDTSFTMCPSVAKAIKLNRSLPITPRIHTSEEECVYGPACWMWDYLRRSGASGFLLPLSGGADSSAVASIVYVMCVMAIGEACAGNLQVRRDLARILKREDLLVQDDDSQLAAKLLQMTADSTGHPKDEMQLTTETSAVDLEYCGLSPQALCNRILYSIYLSTDYSSNSTQCRAKELSSSIGSYHHYISIHSIINAVITTFAQISHNKVPLFESQGGSRNEDIALQNLQARIRMVFSYLCAQLLPWVRGDFKGYLLVLGSANVDEALRGYMTKYDCSSADINPIGGISKGDLQKMLLWISKKFELPILREIVAAPPSAELRPIQGDDTEEPTQTDEEDMGLSYRDLGLMGTLRKVARCGPVTMFVKIVSSCLMPLLTVQEIAAKVKTFFYFYSVNRHKMTVLTPSYHAEGYSPDDNRFDLRPFLYNTKWKRQFDVIDKIVAQDE